MHFDQLLDFQILLLFFTLYYYAILYSLDAGFFNTMRVSNSLDPDHARHFFGPDMGQTVCKGYQQTTKSPLVGIELNIDTTFWLKLWLKLISFGSNFFHLAKVLATTNSEPG